MMMGYYDRNGYGGLYYSNLIPGGVAETSSYGNPGAIVNQSIASTGYQHDFYSASIYGTNTGGGYGYGYGASGDDVSGPYHSFNCLADFMGTSQDSVGNSNGFTRFYTRSDGSRLYSRDLELAGLQNRDGMYGLGEYASWAGYRAANLYSQPTDNMGLLHGFTFADYKAEIDAGRVVMIHVEGHSMFGYGYDALTNEILLHDTWYEGEDRMAWGGSYSGLGLRSVTVMELTGGEVVPVPAAVLLGFLGLGVAGLKLRRLG
jgi:hypothetical protein